MLIFLQHSSTTSTSFLITLLPFLNTQDLNQNTQDLGKYSQDLNLNSKDLGK